MTELVTAHFEREEEGGYFAEAVTRAPRLFGHAQELCLQRETLAEQILSLNSLARSGVEAPAWWVQVEIDAKSFIALLGEHEAHENELQQ